MLNSMTGFATRQGGQGPHSWNWEIRSVNSKGLDLRLRVPDWIDGLEQAVRAAVTKELGRGSVSLGLRVQREEGGAALCVNKDQLAAVLTALEEIETRADEKGLMLQRSKASDIISLRGVLDVSTAQDDTEALLKVLMAELPDLLADFKSMRANEGAALRDVLDRQLSEITELTVKATDAAQSRRNASAQALKDNLAKVMENTEGADPDRVAQELALIAVKADVTEELDRLHAHVDAARALIAKGSPVGRKLDFLMQEFNREANTLCSKAQSRELTAVGLDLKAVIDQMREQVQNVE